VAALAEVRVTRNVPIDVWAIAMPPADASEFPVVAIVTVRPLTDADTDANGWALLEGDVGLPPQPATAPSASAPAALLQHAQNSRRVFIETSSSLITVCHLIRSTSGAHGGLSKNHDNRRPGTSCHP